MITHLEPDILECEVKWALESITTNKASGGDGIPVELLQILKDDAVKVLHLICQPIWKTQQWPQDWKRSVFIPIPKKVKLKVKSLNRVQLFATLWTIAQQAPPSMGFSRQEYWSGLPFPSPGDLPNPGIEPTSPALQADALTSEPPGKPKNTGVGSLSLLQRIFLTQESNWSLLHCRQILYQLSYQGSLRHLENHTANNPEVFWIEDR